MRVLVTGGSGVIGAGLIPALIRRGHHVRLLTRTADKAANQWPDAVDSWVGDVTRPEDLEGCAEGCEAVIHVTGIVAENPPEVTFEKVNVAGTGNVVAEAQRAGTPRLVYVSSLGADRGSSAYHASKRAAEDIVRSYSGNWAILRPGGVYGPGDEVMSLLLQMHRTLPVIPIVGLGDQPFQPLFYVDAGEALAVAAERDDLQGVFEIAGDDVTTTAEIFEMLSDITGRRPAAVHTPEVLARLATGAAEALGMPFPLDEAKIKMLLEGNIVNPPEANALLPIFGVTATPLRQGLTSLADDQPEQEPAEGVGSLEEKRFRADIRGSNMRAAQLVATLRERCNEVMPLEFAAEPGTTADIVEGATLTAAIPMRGNIQVRVVEVTATSFTFATLRGHPLAGTVRFSADDLADGTVRFVITIVARAATAVDWLSMNTVGRGMQEENWKTVVARVVVMTGGMADAIEAEENVLSPDAAKAAEEEAEELIAAMKRNAVSRPPTPPSDRRDSPPGSGAWPR